jgi:hypothetical protein
MRRTDAGEKQKTRLKAAAINHFLPILSMILRGMTLGEMVAYPILLHHKAAVQNTY